MVTTWTKTTKNTATWGKKTKNTSSWTKTSKSVAFNSFILLENGFYILQENSGKIILEQSGMGGASWTKLAKS